MNGQLVVTALNGEDLIPALTYTITVTGVGFVSGSQSTQAGTDPANFNDYPGTLSATYSFTANPIAPPVNTVLPGITGTSADGQTLTAANGTWTGTAPINYTYQWQRCTGASCSNIGSATGSTYVLTSNDVGKTLQVAVKATNSDGTATATSANTGTVTGVAPYITGPSNNPTVSGTVGTGQALTISSPGTWGGTTPITYTYKWQRCISSSCSDIGGANTTSYVVTSADNNAKLQAIVTASNASGSASAPSNQTSTVSVTLATLAVTVKRTSGATCGSGWTVKLSGGSLDPSVTLTANTNSSGVATFSGNVPTNPSSGPVFNITATSGTKTASGTAQRIRSGSNTATATGSSC
jgi:hypothetical protein